jgi:SPASM domain peptide maturase of grasp-with-spasm system
MRDNSDLYINQFATCQTVKGYAKSVIIDFDRERYYNMPNEFINILQRYEGEKIKEIIDDYSVYEFDSIEKGLNLLYTNELIFYSSEPKANTFPNIPNVYFSSCQIENVIIDINDHSMHDYNLIAEKLNPFLLKALQLRFYAKHTISELDAILSVFKDSNIGSIEIIIPNDNNNETLLNKLIDNNKLTFIYQYKSLVEKVSYHKQCTIVQIKEYVDTSGDCGQVSIGNFTCNKKLFLEGQISNTCLNKKLSIDCDGYFKNCPSMSHQYGKYQDVAILDVIRNPIFMKYWEIRKDNIEVCKDCEYRHMCTDCRAYLKQPDNIYSQPAKCNYNPYIAKWKGDEGFIPVEACGFYNDKGKFVLNREKIDSLNFELWGE